uniref:NADH dehydrogenase subunit 6 n=1 Tax=Stigmaeopsis nanjingensis TaxID=486490 RepID=UPI00286A2976|nr:NADH dehydrogenase subunit 6 [Stigmaeopsis nanjingensis]WKW93592.1 NADH dehydrogenase subunit 6 [Stigmaeopsis nanjingensis]
MFYFFYLMLSGFNPMTILIGFSLLFVFLLLNFILCLNDKIIFSLLLLFLVGGMMIFMSMISSTLKYNFSNKKSLFLFLFFMFPLFYLYSFFNFKVSVVFLDNLFIYMINFFILLVILILKLLLFKKQKNLKI